MLKVSCIIPVFNRQDFICTAIRSVSSQHCNVPVETVVVDDGSHDHTCLYVREKFPEVELIETSGGNGPGLTRNIGVEAASGDVLMFLDSDDLWLPCHVEELLAQIHAGAHVAYGIAHCFDHVNGGSFMIPQSGQEISGKCFRDMLSWCFVVPSAVAVRRDAFEDVHGFRNMPFGEDWDFFLRLSMKFPFFNTKKVITQRILHGGSLCASEGLGEKILNMLRELKKSVASSPTASTSDVERFNCLASHAAREGAEWETIQDWYTSLKRHGLA